MSVDRKIDIDLEALPEPACVVSVGGGIEFANNQFFLLFGEQSPGACLLDLLRQEDSDCLRMALASCPSQGGSVVDILVQGEKSSVEDKPSRRCVVSTVPRSDSLLVQFREVHGSPSHDSAALAFARAALSTSSGCILCLRLDGRLVYANESCCKLLGFDRANLLAQSWRELSSTGALPEEGEGRLQLRCSDGAHVAVAIVAREFGAGSKRFICVHASQVPELDAGLEGTQKMELIGRVSAGLAHDFGNQLTIIRGYRDLLSDEILSDADQQQYLDTIAQSCDTAGELVSRLLALGRSRERRVVRADLNEVIRSVSLLVARLIEERIEVHLRLAAVAPFVRIDPFDIEQVLLNLAINARDAMPSGGSLILATTDRVLDQESASRLSCSPGSFVEFTVTDTGSGMDPEVARRVFDPFFSTKGERGSGLGLALTREVVQSIGGAIELETSPQRGTSIRILLPAVEEQSHRAAETVLDGPRDDSLTKLVLVVEDNPDLRYLVGRVLRAEGYEVMEAESPARALTVVDRVQRKFDALIVDVVMPEMTGPQLVAKIRDGQPGVPCLFVSGYPLSEQETGGPVLSKPFSREILRRRVRELFGS